MRKRKGSLLDFLPGLVVILAFTVVLAAFLYFLKIVNYKEDVRQIARGYLLEMETIGYLMPASRTMLLQELEDRELENIDLTGTTQTDAGYGNDIVLSVRGYLPTKALNTSSNDLFSFFFEDASMEIEVYLQSTAKN